MKGRGLTTAEIRAAYAAEHAGAVPSSLTSEVYSLKKRGILETTGGRAGRTLYAPAGSGLQGLPDEEDNALRVLEALRSRFRRLRRPLSTREVSQELKRSGAVLIGANANTVRKCLETLAKPRIRGAKGFRAARARRIEAQTVSGAPSAFWVPAGAQETAVPAPRSASEAVRAAVRHATGVLGRPISAKELRWWFDTPAAADVHRGILERDNLGRVLADTAKADEPHDEEPGRLHTCETWWTCYGGPPTRYWLGAPTPEEDMACEFSDMVAMLRPADELESIAGLRRRAAGIGSWPLERIADLRSQLLLDTFAMWGDGHDKKESTVIAIRALVQLERWLDEARPHLSEHQVESRLRAFNVWKRHLAAGAKLYRASVPSRPVPDRVGRASRISLDELKPLLRAASRWIDLKDERAQLGLLSSARRVPNLSVSHRNRVAEPGSSLVYLDRVDALLAIWEAIPSPRATVLLRDAAETLGHVLRDAHLLKHVVTTVGPRDDYARRNIVVALGLLGEAVEPELAIRAWTSYDDTVAWVLSTVLADPANAAARIAEFDRIAGPGERRVTDFALMRLAAGAVFSVVG